MSIQREIFPDLSDAKICDFLEDQKRLSFSDLQDIANDRAQHGYDLDPHSEVIGVRKLAMRTFAQKRVDLFSNPAHRLIRSHEIIDPVDHPIQLSIHAVLFFRRGLDTHLKDRILDVLTNIDLANIDQDAITESESRIIQAGASADDYQVDLSFELTRIGTPEIRLLNLTAFVEQMRAYKKEVSGQPVYLVDVHEGFTQLCNLPDRYFLDDLTTPVSDADHPENEIAEEENEKRPPECERLELTDHRIGTVFQLYEWKTEWEVRPIRVGPCQIMLTKIPVIYSRIRKEALWGVAMTDAQIKHNMENALLNCLENAAMNTAALAVVTDGLGLEAAGEAFVTYFNNCIEQSITNAVRCIFASLKLVTERGDWEEKVF